MPNVTEIVPASEYRNRLKKSKSEQLHDKFSFDCRVRRLPAFVPEHRFAKEQLGRQWRFDFAWPEFMVAVEIEGLVIRRQWVAELEGSQPIERNGRIVNVKSVESKCFAMGGHATPEGLQKDIEKYNAAIELGWSVLRFEQKAIMGGENPAIDTTIRVLCAKGWRS